MVLPNETGSTWDREELLVRVTVLLPTRLIRTPDGSVWSQHPPSYSFFLRYLNIFSEVNAVSRVKHVDRLEGDWHRVDGDCVSVSSIPYFVGPMQYARGISRTLKALSSAIDEEDALILRDYGALGGATSLRFRLSGRPYGIEVIGNPYDVFAPGAMNHPLRAMMRIVAPKLLRYVCVHACAATYVTERTLQRKYPTNPFAVTTYFSSVQLPESAFARTPRNPDDFSGNKRLLFVGSMAQKYKGAHILLQALADAMGHRLDWRLTMVGDGVHRSALERQARELGLTDRVTFRGRLAGAQEVRKEFGNCDLYVHPALTEGMPRALIEAMAQALPCIGSDIGGIPEILETDCLVPPGDHKELGKRIIDVLLSRRRMARMSERNLVKSREFKENVLMKRRDAFYGHVMTKTKHWLLEHKMKSKTSVLPNDC
jgi:glycosyltransferase involved in cell wall biosynthesis